MERKLVMQNDENLVVYNSPNKFQSAAYNKHPAGDTFWDSTFYSTSYYPSI